VGITPSSVKHHSALEKVMTNIIPFPPVHKPAPRGFRWVFTPYFIHWRSKKRVYRKNGGMFAFLVKAA
jgi:hypothetical protein